MKKINVTSSSMPDFTEYVDEIKDLWDSKWLTNMGSKHHQLETELLDYLKVENISLFTNGHLALEGVIEAMDLSGEVITTPYTFASTTTAIVRNGLTPVFCDINDDDYTIDVNQIESLITDKTSAIMPVHVYGNVCDVKEINRIAKKHNLKVIYDAAHTFGVEVEGVGIGSFGDASMFSFHATKVFNTIEGGAVTFNNHEYKDKLEALKNFGKVSEDVYEYAGGNAKMNEFQAAMGLTNLKHVESEINKRKKVFERYISNLKNVKGIKLPKLQNGVKPNYSYFPIIFEKFSKTRNEVFEEFNKHNIGTRKYFYPLMNHLEFFDGKFRDVKLPIAEHVSKSVLTLPLYADLSLNDVDKITEIIISMEDEN